jgi:hypothetical protein
MATILGHLVVGIVILGGPLSGNFALADDKSEAAKANHLALLERFVGEWTVHGKWNSGDELQARTAYEWGLGNKIIKYKTFVKTDKGEYQRYDGTMAWHPKKNSLFIISFSYDGGMTENIIDPKDADTLQIGFTPFQEGESGKVRQIIQFKDKDHFTWQVLLKNDTDWQEIINATWERKPSPASH